MNSTRCLKAQAQSALSRHKTAAALRRVEVRRPGAATKSDRRTPAGMELTFAASWALFRSLFQFSFSKCYTSGFFLTGETFHCHCCVLLYIVKSQSQNNETLSENVSTLSLNDHVTGNVFFIRNNDDFQKTDIISLPSLSGHNEDRSHRLVT